MSATSIISGVDQCLSDPVTLESMTTKTVSYNDLIPALIVAIQELHAEVEDLKQQLNQGSM